MGEIKFSSYLELNDMKIKKSIKSINNIVLAWGDRPNNFRGKMHYERRTSLLEYLEKTNKKIYVFNTNRIPILTKKGQPRHPSRNSLTKLVPCRIGKGLRIVI